MIASRPLRVSRWCVKTWIERFSGAAKADLVTRFSRPHPMPNGINAQIEAKVVSARVEHQPGPDIPGPTFGSGPDDLVALASPRPPLLV